MIVIATWMDDASLKPHVPNFWFLAIVPGALLLVFFLSA